MWPSLLTIDGGGGKGIIPAAHLRILQKRLRACVPVPDPDLPANDPFNLARYAFFAHPLAYPPIAAAGTSTGGIAAIGLAARGTKTGPGCADGRGAAV